MNYGYDLVLCTSGTGKPVARAQGEGLQLTGEGGLLQRLAKRGGAGVRP